MGCVDDRVVAAVSGKHGIQCRLCEGKLVPAESGRVDAASIIEVRMANVLWTTRTGSRATSSTITSAMRTRCLAKSGRQ
jgi:hypothetical protein